MEQAIINTKMMIFLLETGKMIIKKDKVSTLIKMVIFMMENGILIKKMGLVF